VKVDYGLESHPGLDPTKQLNEDSCGVAETRLGFLCVLCDGMGGHSAGEVASRTAVSTVSQRIAEAPADADVNEALHRALEAANDAVCAIVKGGKHAGRPGSTCVAALFAPTGLRIAHVGDSRGYLIREGQIKRMTRDHSVVGELLAAGAITPEQAVTHPNAHHITRALGMNPKVVVDVSAALPLRAGDSVVICSDGLSDLVEDNEILADLQRVGEAQGISQRLVKLALERGGHDNVTVQCIRVVEAVDMAPTVVDTFVDGDHAPNEPAPTMLETPMLEPAGPGPTLVSEAAQRPKVAPTMVDHPERATPIAPFPPAELQAQKKGAPATLPPDVPLPRRRELSLVTAGLLLVGVILGAIVLWWLARGGR
jgi:serine/threonine protein phosphatase PrpC